MHKKRASAKAGALFSLRFRKIGCHIIVPHEFDKTSQLVRDVDALFPYQAEFVGDLRGNGDHYKVSGIHADGGVEKGFAVAAVAESKENIFAFSFFKGYSDK